MRNDKAFLLYESAYKTFERRFRRDKVAAARLINAIMRYGLYEEEPEDNEENADILEIWEPIITSISSAKDRRKRQMDNGSKGGRPSVNLDMDEVYEVKKELGTWKATAKHFGLDEDTLRKYRKSWEAETEKPKNRDEETEKPNLKENRKTEKPTVESRKTPLSVYREAEKPKNLSESESESESESDSETIYSAWAEPTREEGKSLGENLAPISGTIDYSDAFEETEEEAEIHHDEFFGQDGRKTSQEFFGEDALKKAYNFYSGVPQRKVGR